MRPIHLTGTLVIALLALSAAGCTTEAAAPAGSSTPVVLTPYRSATPLPPPLEPGSPAPTAVLTPTPTPFLYTLQEDELVSAVALKFGVSLAQIQAANPGVNLNFPARDQQLVIPQASPGEGDPLASPTPVPLSSRSLVCYPAAAGEAWCFGVLVNDLTDPVLYAGGEFLVSGTGGSPATQPFQSLLDMLPPGSGLPVYARFPAPFPYPYQVSLRLLTGLRGSLPAESARVTVSGQTVTLAADGMSARITGSLQLGEGAPRAAAVVAAGYAGQDPAGIRRLEITGLPEGAQTVPFELMLYSAGPVLDRVELFAEPFLAVPPASK